MEGLWQPYIEHVYWHHFSNSICLFCIPVSHFGNPQNISKFSIIITFVMVVMIFAVTTCFEVHELHPYKMANLFDKYYICSNCSTDWLFHLLSSSLYSLRCNNIEIRPINTMTSKCSSEGKCHMSLTLSQKLDMIKLSEERCGKSRQAES